MESAEVMRSIINRHHYNNNDFSIIVPYELLKQEEKERRRYNLLLAPRYPFASFKTFFRRCLALYPLFTLIRHFSLFHSHGQISFIKRLEATTATLFDSFYL